MKLSKTKKGVIIISIFIILSLFDLIFPSKGVNVDRTLPKFGRAFFFGLMLITCFRIRLKYVKLPKPITGKAIDLILFLFLVVSLFNLDLLVVNVMSYIKVLYWICGFYFFYYLIITGIITEKHLRYFTIFAVIIYYLVVLRDYLDRDLWEGSKTFFVSNNAYHLLKFFPLVLLFRGKLTNILILLISIGIILAFKRGALLAFTISFLIYYLYILFKEKEKKLLKLMLGVVVLVIGWYYFSANIDVFAERMEDFESVETAGSGRGNMFTLILDYMININSSPWILLIGNGFFATMDFYQETINHRIVAHSDVLELFFDYGLLGLFTIVFLFFRVYKLFRFYKNEFYGLVLVIWMISIGLSSVYSINFFGPEMIYAIIPIVYLEGKRIFRINNIES